MDRIGVAGIPLRVALHGSDQARPAMKANIDTFKAAGMMPRVGQATQRPLAQVAESAASKIVGGYGPMPAPRIHELRRREGKGSAGRGYDGLRAFARL
jgi:hypothetical protein